MSTTKKIEGIEYEVVKKGSLPRTINGMFQFAEITREKIIEEQALDQNVDDCLNDYFRSTLKIDWAGAKGAKEYEAELHGGSGALEAAEITSTSGNTEGLIDELTPSVEGVFNDPVAYIEGQPECMADFAMQPINNYLSVVIFASVSASETLESMQKKAKAIAAAINVHELTGTRVRIELVWNSSHDLEGKEQFRLILKDHQDSWVPHIHGYALANFSTVRAIGFAYASKMRTWWGLGTQGFSGVEQQISTYEKTFGPAPEGAKFIVMQKDTEEKIKQTLAVS